KEFPDGLKAHGCDALRFTFASLASTGRDINFDMGRIEGYRNFCNKIFNASRFVLMNTEDYQHQNTTVKPQSNIESWILSRLQNCVAEYHKQMKCYRLDLASQAIYDFFWNEYCDWFLELSKPMLKASDKNSIQHTLLYVLEKALLLLHPIMPFITEEIWQAVKPKLNISDKTIMLSSLPSVESQLTNPKAEQEIQWLKEVTLNIRQIRAEMNIPPAKPLDTLFSNCSDEDMDYLQNNKNQLQSIARLESIDILKDGQEEPPAATALLNEMKILIPLAGIIDQAEETARIEKQIQKMLQEIKRGQGKLNNQKFVEKAPAHLVEQEKTKLLTNQNSLLELKEALLNIKSLNLPIS
ncbi:MAG: class I tRNA ligase family protein, partial [Proteobacteria bacterium]|nr:class I tRNA ligase family protein [Pseudomonadota bacterium]